MSVNSKVDAYLVVYAPPSSGPSFRSDYLLANSGDAVARIRLRLQALGRPLEVLGLPSRPSLMVSGLAPAIVEAVVELVVRIRIAASDVAFFKALVVAAPSGAGPAGRLGAPLVVVGFGIEAAIAAAGYWEPMPEGGKGFGSRADAEALIGADTLAAHQLTGKGVNVVLIDSGLDAVEKQQLGLNWALNQTGQPLQVPGDQYQVYLPEAAPAPRYDHAWHSARHIRALAPDATVYDYAILPPRLSKANIPSVQVKIQSLISDMVAAYLALEAQIDQIRTAGPAPFVVINAWAIYRRPPTPWDGPMMEAPGEAPNLRYTLRMLAEPERMDLDFRSAYFNGLIDRMVTKHAVDFVFASGNGGQFSADPRCGRNDRGPRRSTIGPAGHPAVTTVSGCWVDGTWIGSSSEGPSIMDPLPPGTMKPDFAAPSGFFEDDDMAHVFSGTSTACAVAGATMAALRQKWPGWTPAARKALAQRWPIRVRVVG